MSGDQFTEKLGQGEEFFDAFRQMSDLLNGAVRTLVTEGWTEQQARDIVVATFMSNARSAK